MKTFFLNFKKQRFVGTLNICTLSLGIMVAVIVGLWVIHELSFDRFHKDKDRIYRIISHWSLNDEIVKTGVTWRPFGSEAKEKLAAIEDVCRVAVLIGENNSGITIDEVVHTGLRVLSKKFFPQQNPIGQTLKFNNV